MNILEKIVADKRMEVAKRKQMLPLAEFKDRLSESDRDFKQALRQDHRANGAAFIMEVKKASPSKGLIRENFDLDEICEAYGKYASCVSVLTDEKYFQGEFERLPKVRNRLAQPVLCKDFFVDAYQIYLARHYGANAILLMLSVLADDDYRDLAAVATSLGMDVLTEVSNKQEMVRAVALKADILGINNRNLRDLSTDLNQTPVLVNEFFKLASDEQIAATFLISESGVYHHDQVKKLGHYVQGFLVGSSLMAENDLNNACRALTRGLNKVCGITSSIDANKAYELGARLCGLILVESSPRYVSLEAAKQIMSDSNPQIGFVTVVKDLKPKDALEIVSRLRPYAIQLHGNESQQYIDNLRREFKQHGIDTQIWKALAIDVDGTLPLAFPTVDLLLLDTKSPTGQSGGTGVAFDWGKIGQLPLDMPPVILAGGLNKDNVELAKSLAVTGLDFNSGVESAPGVKDHRLLEAVFSVL